MFPTVLPETIAKGQVHTPVGRPLVTMCGVGQSTLGQSSPHTLLCRPSCFFQGQWTPSLWGPCPVTGELLRGEATGCSACQMDTAFPRQSKSSPWPPASWLCEQTQKKSPPAACRQAPWWQPASSCPHPSIGSFSRILPGAPLGFSPGSHGEEAGQVQAEAALLRVQPHQAMAQLSLWELLGTLQTRNGFRASERFPVSPSPPPPAFPESELHAFRKAPLTCEITFRAKTYQEEESPCG